MSSGARFSLQFPPERTEPTKHLSLHSISVKGVVRGKPYTRYIIDSMKASLQ